MSSCVLPTFPVCLGELRRRGLERWRERVCEKGEDEDALRLEVCAVPRPVQSPRRIHHPHGWTTREGQFAFVSPHTMCHPLIVSVVVLKLNFYFYTPGPLWRNVVVCFFSCRVVQTLKKFPCNKCESSFTTTSSLTRHIRDKHKVMSARGFRCQWVSCTQFRYEQLLCCSSALPPSGCKKINTDISNMHQYFAQEYFFHVAWLVFSNVSSVTVWLYLIVWVTWPPCVHL